MKTFFGVLIALTVSLGATAQRKGGFYHSYSPRVIVAPSVGFGLGLGYGYSYWGYPFFGYPYFGYPYRTPYGYRNSYNLSLQIQSIKLEYKNQIRDTRHNSSLTHVQRREAIRTLKTQREQAIITAEQNYRYGNRNNQYRGGNNNQYQQSPNNPSPAPGNQNPGASNQGQDNSHTSLGS